MQSPAISFVRVSSPMYWPSNLDEPCAHAPLASAVPSRRPNPRHLSIPFFPFRFSKSLQLTSNFIGLTINSMLKLTFPI